MHRSVKHSSSAVDSLKLHQAVLAEHLTAALVTYVTINISQLAASAFMTILSENLLQFRFNMLQSNHRTLSGKHGTVVGANGVDLNTALFSGKYYYGVNL